MNPFASKSLLVSFVLAVVLVLLWSTYANREGAYKSKPRELFVEHRIEKGFSVYGIPPVIEWSVLRDELLKEISIYENTSTNTILLVNQSTGSDCLLIMSDKATVNGIRSAQRSSIELNGEVVLTLRDDKSQAFSRLSALLISEDGELFKYRDSEGCELVVQFGSGGRVFSFTLIGQATK